MTKRETAREAVRAAVTDRATYEHQRNYERLHVLRDGTITWTESIEKSTDIIDRLATGFRPIRSICCVGTGPFACNCDYCSDESYESRDEAIADAVSESDLTGYEAEMVAVLDAFEYGYFEDESTEIWHVSDGNAELEIEAETSLEAAREYVRDGNWTGLQTDWTSVTAWRIGTDGEPCDQERHTIAIEPTEPSCTSDEGHEWEAPLELVGGCKENPGVYGHGGGVTIQEACLRCGCGKLTDTWAQDDNGRQGLTSVAYQPNKYAHEARAAQEALVAQEEPDGE